MKKYDFILMGLYIIPVILVCIFFYVLKHPSNVEIKKAEIHFKELYRRPVKNVVIQETDMHIKVFQTPEKIQQGFKLTGILAVEQVPCYQVSGDTLFIRHGNVLSESAVNLWLSDDVKLDIIDAPSVSVSKRKIEENNN